MKCSTRTRATNSFTTTKYNELRGILTGNNTTTNIYMKLKVKRNRFYKMEKENLEKNAIIYVQ